MTSRRSRRADRKIADTAKQAHLQRGDAARAAARGSDVRAAGNQAVQRALKAGHEPPLEIGQRGDRSEREADTAAHQVARGSAVSQPTRALDDAASRGQAAPQSVARTLARPGSALPPPVREQMESAFARDFRDVRLHADASARESAAAISARAYTHRTDIVLGSGAPNVTSVEGRSLLAHELTHVTQDHPGVIHRQTLASEIPPEVDVGNVSASFTLPAGKQLTDNWNDVSTTDATVTKVTLKRTGLTLSFDPPLRIDVQWPGSDLAWSNVVYDFATGTVTSVGLTKTDTGLDYTSDARTLITSSITTTLTGSRAADAGYDPMTDPNPGETLSKIKDNIVAAPSKGSEVAPADITNVSMSADLTFTSEIRKGDAEGMVVIPAGGSATITADLSGTLADVSARPKISAVHLASNGITIQQGGDDVARIKRLTVLRGGAVMVEDFEPLGKAKTAAAGETIANVIGLLALLGSATSEDRPALAGRDPHVGATYIPAAIRNKLDEALTRAVIELLQVQALNLPPGIDLYELFNIRMPPGDYPVPPTGPGSTAYG